MQYYLGVDAGGTKTHVLIGDADGHVLGFGKAGAGNYECYGYDAAYKEIEKAVNGALETAGLTLGQIDGIGMGIAGADLPENYVDIEREIFTPMFGAIPRNFRNDSMGGLRGGTKDPFGIVIACGTGCVCAGVNRQGKDTRVGGISEEFGDMVSGSSIGIEGLKAVWRYRDGIIGETKMAKLFIERAGCKDIEELFYTFYKRKLWYDDIQPMAKLVFDAAYDGDEAACDILEWGGRYLADMVNTVARHLDMSRDTFDVVMTGSVFKGASPVLIDAMSARVHRQCPNARPVRALFEPVVGAMLLGVELHHEMNAEKYAVLEADLDGAAERFGVRFRPE